MAYNDDQGATPAYDTYGNDSGRQLAAQDLRNDLLRAVSNHWRKISAADIKTVFTDMSRWAEGNKTEIPDVA